VVVEGMIRTRTMGGGVEGVGVADGTEEVEVVVVGETVKVTLKVVGTTVVI
jgi:hypothetical protein